MNKWIILVLSSFLFFACENSGTSETSEKVVEEIKADDVASIIRNPVTATEEVDINFVPKMTFDQTTFDFGTVKEGEKVEHTFKFENTGEVPLLIGDARSTCGCTVPTYPKEMVKPGKKGEIKVIFDSKNLTGFQTKPITITSNTYPRDVVLYLKGMVEGHKH